MNAGQHFFSYEFRLKLIMQSDGGIQFLSECIKTVMANDKRPAEIFAKAIDVLCKQSRKQAKLQHLSYKKSKTG
jgi:hypothetical protein